MYKLDYDYYSASGNGKFSCNYFYDIKNNKELKLYEVLPKMGYCILDIQKFGVNSFEDFKELERFEDGPYHSFSNLI